MVVVVMKVLRIYTASDDLVEFDGAVEEEFNVYEEAEFSVTAVSPRGERSFSVCVYFDWAWRLSLDFYGSDEEEPCDPNVCRFTGIEVAHTGKNLDPMFVIPFEDDETVTVERIGVDDDD